MRGRVSDLRASREIIEFMLIKEIGLGLEEIRQMSTSKVLRFVIMNDEHKRIQKEAEEREASALKNQTRRR